MSTYPPAPWDLTAHAYVGVFTVPARLLADQAPPGTRPLSVLGRTLVGTAYFVYEEPSPLTYHEVMATMLVRDGWRVRVTITRIWVDSVASREGGRALWAIPKELADFTVEPHRSYESAAAGIPIGTLTVGRTRTVPLRLPIGFSVAQERDHRTLVTKVRGRGRIGVAKSAWSFAATGPLGYLAGRTPLLSLVLRPLRIVFGA